MFVDDNGGYYRTKGKISKINRALGRIRNLNGIPGGIREPNPLQVSNAKKKQIK